MAWQGGRRATAAAALVTMVALLFASCGGDDDDATGGDEDVSGELSDDEATTDEATTTTQSPEDEVLEAYRAAREAIFAAYDPPNPTDPDVVALVEGEALGAVQNALGQAQADGVAYTGPFELNPQVVSQAGDEAVVEDCVSEHTQRVSTRTSEPVGEPFDLVHHDRIDLQRIDDVWKIVRIQELTESCTP